ncbi:MAG: alpha/beta fold hydrolase, partial [Chloroflexota bacterium]|nr:alpha/beta fold hydrolase [Chloroflexota bacterium]
MRIHRPHRRPTPSSVPHRVGVVLVLTLLVACGGGKGTPTAPPASATLAATPTTGSASPTGAAPETPDASAPAGVPAASAAPIVATVASSGSPTPTGTTSAGTGTAGTPGVAATAAQTTVVAGTTLAARTQAAGTASVNVTAQVGIGTAAVATTAAGGTVPRFAAAACPFKLGPGEEDGQNVACGYLVVPEEHAHPAGRTIRLAVATVKSVGAPPAPEPIIVLNGGPGQGSEGFLAGFLSDRLPLKALLERYTVVFFDQRGTGYSQPSLACPDAGGATPGGAIAATAPTEQELAAPIKCHDRLVSEGVNLSAYNSAESAADVNDLRTALRYDQVNLLGISYGTRLALTVLRDFPQIVRSTV